jgi:CubicO group peptidase (beta-lactamase class C family)
MTNYYSEILNSNNLKKCYEIASPRVKQFVSFSILLLEEEGKLSLDEDIRKYFTKFPDYGKVITIRHLIHHTSGIRDYLGLMYIAGMNFANDYFEEEIIDLLAWQKGLNFMPGEEHLYSNSGYFLLGEIVKQVSGKTLGEFATEKIFKPLGMKSTQFYDDYNRIVKNRGIGYMPKEKGGFSTELSLFDLVGDGGVLTSVEDLLLWDSNFYNNKLGKGGQTIIDKMHQVGKLNSGKKLTYAFALNVTKDRGLKRVSHGGAWAGYQAQLIRYPEEKFSVACLSNLGVFNPTRLADQVINIYLKDKIKPEKKLGKKRKIIIPKTITLSAKRLKRFAGFFRSRKPIRTWTITINKDKLKVSTSAGYTLNFSPVSKHTIFSEEMGIPIFATFYKNNKNRKTEVKIVVGTRDPVYYHQAEKIALTAEALEEYSGDYFSEELNTTYNLIIKGGKLFPKVRYNPLLIPMAPSIKDEFLIRGVVVSFNRDKDNKITGFNLGLGRVKGIFFKKK